MVKIKKKSLFLMLSLFMILQVTFPQHAKAAPAVLYTGTQGTVTWTIYDNKELVFSPASGDTGTFGDMSPVSSTRPWSQYNTEFSSVRFEGTIYGGNSTSHMFSGSQAASLNLSNFDTSKVMNMNGMFYGSQATSLDVSTFNTSNVTDMGFMFAGSHATSLDLSNFDTSKVMNMSGMFSGSKSAALNVSNFNTSNVTDMRGMFSGSEAVSLDLSSFDTSKIMNMRNIFSGSQAKSLVLSKDFLFKNGTVPPTIDTNAGYTGKWIKENKTYGPFTPSELATEFNNDPTALAGKWIAELKKNNITFNSNGGSGTMTGVIVESGSYTLPANGFTAPSGKQFKGWATSADGEIISGAYNLTEDTEFYAVWENIPAPVEYYITVTDGTAMVDGSEVNRAEAGKTVNIVANAAPAGKVFAKWIVESGNITLTDEGLSSTAFTMPAGDISVKATYEDVIAATYTVTFNTNGHGIAPAPQTVTSGGNAVQPANPAEAGWIFGGWYEEASCITPFDFYEPITANITVYAKWTETGLPPPTPIYNMVSGANGSWKKGSGSGYELVVKRNAEDSTAFAHFTSIMIDGTELTKGTDYEVMAGSGVIINIKESFLENLGVGTHTVNVNFNDGVVVTEITVKTVSEAPSPSPTTTSPSNPASVVNNTKATVPKTGNGNGLIVGIVLIIISGSLLAFIGYRRRKNAE